MYYINTPHSTLFQEFADEILQFFKFFARKITLQDKKFAELRKKCYISCLYLCAINMGVFAMLLGMSDPWVAAAYLANIVVTIICVIYGAVNYNTGDDSENVK